MLYILLIILPMICLVIVKRLTPTLDPREPPLVSSRLPLGIDHIISFILQGPLFLSSTSARTTAPIHTLFFVTARQYVATDPGLIASLSRASKTVSFNPFIAELGIRLTGASNDARCVIETNIEGRKGEFSYVVGIHDAMIKAMVPGPLLDDQTRNMMAECESGFIRPLERQRGFKGVGLHAWMRHAITLASTSAIYGSRNPFALQTRLVEDFWTYNDGINRLLIGVLPQLTARKAFNARARMARGFEKFFESDPSNSDAVYLAKERYRIGHESGMNYFDLGLLEVGSLIGVLVNTVPSAFYLLVHIMAESEGQLLKDVRSEIETNAVVKEGETHILDTRLLREQCPLFYAVFQETLRQYSINVTARFVLEDTIVDDRWLLKKGGIIQMPNSVIHHEPRTWHDTSFTPRRFLRQDLAKNDPSVQSSHPDHSKRDEFPQMTASKGRPPTSAAAFRPFGGGSTLCPGRHFATNEILGLVGLMIWRFDIEAVSGRIEIPKPKQMSIVEGVCPPETDIDVNISLRRDVAESWDWRLK